MISNRITRRETAATFRDVGKRRNVILIIEPSGVVGVKLKGLRKTEYLTADIIYEVAVKARVRAEAREKKLNRKLRRGNGR